MAPLLSRTWTVRGGSEQTRLEMSTWLHLVSLWNFWIRILQFCLLPCKTRWFCFKFHQAEPVTAKFGFFQWHNSGLSSSWKSSWFRGSLRGRHPSSQNPGVILGHSPLPSLFHAWTGPHAPILMENITSSAYWRIFVDSLYLRSPEVVLGVTEC